MPVLQGIAETVGGAAIELLYWCSVRPHGACAIAATCFAIACCVMFSLPGSWALGIGLTVAAAGAGMALVGGSISCLNRDVCHCGLRDARIVCLADIRRLIDGYVS